MSEKIVVIGETKDGSLRNVSYEAIAAAKKVDAEAELVGVICGSGELEELGKEMIYYGADRVVTISHDSLTAYTSEGFGQAVLAVIHEESPKSIVMGHTSIGKDLTPKIASKLETGLISDAVDIEVEGDKIQFVRPIYSGKAFEKKIITDGITFFTIRPNNIPALNRDEARSGEITPKNLDITDIRTVIKDVVRKASEGVDLSEANVIVAGGRGVKSEDGFKPLYELAEVLGGAVGASRGACDAEYCDYSLQIGQTGKVVTPDLYIAVGISGAIQHLAGMSNSKVIVAINKDPEANIFNVADYGIVGDLFEVIPLLIEEVKKLQEGITNS
ncbi:MAG: electron transfer flavoprotein subunit alpha/FixB family protein [Bacillota bacterium]|uniref:Electron transfer flavoprotein subunit alpha/FixB family protein n=1 Tax=Virgibacillus salarius TaxID=447199 RepID=A0A941IBJ1_9BACI|nr:MULTISPECIES: electron transfer flavoprotein subunit alpha/FixB family protein [Bacillaceae]MBR7797808.1 electron transfer flavoprotein subunit alpha/FixB family protein [Virgibacillus salarius]NAZ10518.1 electron transfer flavoprotein subunit alpha/FixB family protein [Agaribacter marinus]MCC2250350.1 electron transfer flavoprotein subunit alpha/FixB family protein [Virgibacillus sp. AGTR]MDY7044089.1 electron transfer flavoprotein subunit alpha/FixB family protein [Virgibacillus sp. M23]Q